MMAKTSLVQDPTNGEEIDAVPNQNVPNQKIQAGLGLVIGPCRHRCAVLQRAVACRVVRLVTWMLHGSGGRRKACLA